MAALAEREQQQLSLTETAIGCAVAQGLEIAEIAVALELSETTVEWRLRRIFRILGARSLAEVAMRFDQRSRLSLHRVGAP